MTNISASISHIIMQLFCNKNFDWLVRQNLRTYNERYPVAKSRRPNHKYIYPYVYMQIYFPSSDFARILTTVSNLKKINTNWIENIYIKITLNRLKWGKYSSFTLSGSQYISCFPRKRNVVIVTSSTLTSFDANFNTASVGE